VEGLFYNKNLIKRLFKISRPEAESNYRFYLIAKKHFHNRSGIFSIDELLDILYTHYYFRSLHHSPGNNRSRYRERFIARFRESVLFEELQDGRFRICSERKL
jgi:hypothetical protein